MNILFKSICIIFPFLFVIACEKHENNELQPENRGKEVTFSLSKDSNEPLTRATDNLFETGDQIGIYVVKRTNPNIPGVLEPSGNFADNKLYRIDNNGQLQPYDNSNKIYLLPNEVYDFYAFYPYQNIKNKQFSYSVFCNQNEKSSYQRSDLMQSKVLNVRNTNNVNLTFKHLMALIELHFKKESEFSVTNVSMLDFNRKCQIDIQTGETVAVSDVATIDMFKYGETETNYIYRALIPEQEIKNNKQIFKISRNDNAYMIYVKENGNSFVQNGSKKIFPCNAQYKLQVFSYYKDWGDVSESDGIYNHGDIVTVTAYPKAGYEFAGWQLAQNGSNHIVSYDKNYSFSITNETSLGAIFTPKKVSVTVNVVTLGGGTGGEIKGGIGLQEVGKNILIIAEAYFNSQGYVFLGFYDQNGNLVSANNNYEFTVPDHDVVLEARFEKQFCVIRYSTEGGGNLSASANGSNWGNGTLFKKNDYCCVRALAQYGYEFEGWYENNNFVSTSPEYGFHVTTDRNLVAKFKPKTYHINLQTNNVLRPNGDVKGTGSYTYGSSCTVHAILADEYCRFFGWYENDVLVSTDMNYTFPVTENRILLAKFDRAIGQGELGLKLAYDKYAKRFSDLAIKDLYIEAGAKILSNVHMSYEITGGNHYSPFTINFSAEIIRDGETVFVSPRPENFTYVIPKSGNYTFYYHMDIAGLNDDETVIGWGTWHNFIWKN